MGFPLYSEDPARHRPRGPQTRRGSEMNELDSVGGYSVPVDPMDDLQCDSCQ